jgi:oligopeptide/dipeptide ABC transporter ATP-binding protein
MRYGFYLPTRGRTATAEALETLVTRGAALGFSSVVIADHIVFPVTIKSKYPYTVSGAFPGQGDALEQLSLMAFVAGKTRTLRLISSVMILPHRNPVVTAKMLPSTCSPTGASRWGSAWAGCARSSRPWARPISTRGTPGWAVEMLHLVQVPAPRERVRDYPHQLSGGLRQRAMLALALISNPQLLIADEPTTALDVTIQAQILDLLRRLQAERGMAVLMITHDLGVVAELCHRVAVIYAGRIVELAPVERIFARPLHPYTRGLLRCLPHPSRFGQPLFSIEGTPPDPRRPSTGCRFVPRCPHAVESCRRDEPPLEAREPGHLVACPVTT